MMTQSSGDSEYKSVEPLEKLTWLIPLVILLLSMFLSVECDPNSNEDILGLSVTIAGVEYPFTFSSVIQARYLAPDGSTYCDLGITGDRNINAVRLGAGEWWIEFWRIVEKHGKIEQRLELIFVCLDLSLHSFDFSHQISYRTWFLSLGSIHLLSVWGFWANKEKVYSDITIPFQLHLHFQESSPIRTSSPLRFLLTL